jgi:hypothetical protein
MKLNNYCAVGSARPTATTCPEFKEYFFEGNEPFLFHVVDWVHNLTGQIRHDVSCKFNGLCLAFSRHDLMKTLYEKGLCCIAGALMWASHSGSLATVEYVWENYTGIKLIWYVTDDLRLGNSAMVEFFTRPEVVDLFKRDSSYSILRSALHESKLENAGSRADCTYTLPAKRIRTNASDSKHAAIEGRNPATESDIEYAMTKGYTQYAWVCLDSYVKCMKKRKRFANRHLQLIVQADNLELLKSVVDVFRKSAPYSDVDYLMALSQSLSKDLADHSEWLVGLITQGKMMHSEQAWRVDGIVECLNVGVQAAKFLWNHNVDLTGIPSSYYLSLEVDTLKFLFAKQECENWERWRCFKSSIRYEDERNWRLDSIKYIVSNWESDWWDVGHFFKSIDCIISQPTSADATLREVCRQIRFHSIVLGLDALQLTAASEHCGRDIHVADSCAVCGLLRQNIGVM